MDMGIRKFDDLRVWKGAHELTLRIYDINCKDWKVLDQIRRAAASVPANISEGCGRGSTNELIRFLIIARGSLEEVKYFLILSRDLGYISSAHFGDLFSKAEDTSKMLNGLIKSLRHK